MGGPPHDEYPPLWPDGFSPISLDEIRQRCVDAFPLSKTRKELFDSLVRVVEACSSVGVSGKLWVDGAFVTEAISPSKIVLILEIDEAVYENGSGRLRKTVDAFVDATDDFPPENCDTNLAFLFGWPQSDGNDVIGYWRQRLGRNLKTNGPQGILIVPLPVR